MRRAASSTSLRAAIASGDESADAAGFAGALRDAGSIVVVWGEDILAGDDREQTSPSRCSASPTSSASTAWKAAGSTRSRRRRTAAASARSAAPRTSAPGSPRPSRGRSADEIRAALESGEIEALILADVDPVRDFDDPEGWKRALSAAKFTLSISMFAGASAQASTSTSPPRATPRRRAPSPIPTAACSASAPRSPTRAWSVRSGRRSASCRPASAPTRAPAPPARCSTCSPPRSPSTTASPSTRSAAWACAGRTLQRRGFGARGRRRSGGRTACRRAPRPRATGLRLGTYKDLWADYVAEENPALRFLVPGQTLELNPADAERLGVRHGRAGRGRARTAVR